MSTDNFAHQAAVLVLGGLPGKFLTATAAQEAPVRPSGVWLLLFLSENRNRNHVDMMGCVELT